MSGVVGRVKIQWSGFQGAPGLTVLHFGAFPHDTWTQAQADAAVVKTDAFIQFLKAHIAYGASLVTQADTEAIDVTTGELIAIVTTTPAAAATSTQSLGQKFTAASGAVVNWKTNEIRNGRRMRGRSFLVPLGISVVENNGTLDPGFMTSLNTAATALRAVSGSSNLMVYGRPSAPGATDGTVGGVIAHSVPDMAAVLRSRRD